MTTSVLNKENLTGVNKEGKHPNRPLKYLTATSIIGDKVYNDKDEHMGAIEEIMIDITTGQIEYVVIKFGGFLTINEKAPGFDMNQWPETNFHPEQQYWNFAIPG